MKPLKLMLIGLMALAPLGCRSEGDDDDDSGMDSTGGVDGGETGRITVYDVQKGEVALGAVVTVDDVVVTGVDKFAGGGAGRNVYVQDPAGGPFSGVLVRDATVEGGTIDDVNVGDLVTISQGTVDEFALDSDMSGRKTTQLRMAIIIKKGTAALPAAQVLNPWDLAASDDEAEKWEGVLVKFENVAVNSNGREVSMDPAFLEFFITGPLRMDSQMTDLSALERDTCYASITGVLDYFFNYKLVPTRAADLVAGGNCLFEGGAPEAPDEALCGNGMDDDHDGFSDCEDIPCQDAVGPSCFSVSSVADVQKGSFEGPMAGTMESGTLVRFAGLVVTAVSFDGKSLWVADQAGGEYSGVYFYRPEGVAGIVAGDLIDAYGTTKEHKAAADTSSLTEIVSGSVMKVGGPMSLPAAGTVLTTDQANAVATAEPWEGSLVELQNVKVEADGEFGAFTVKSGATAAPLFVDDFIFADLADPAVPGTCYASVKGVLTFEFSAWRVYPRNAGDLVAGGTCP